MGQEPSGLWYYRIPLGGGRRKYKGRFPSRQLADDARRVALGVLAYNRAGVIPDAKAVPRIGVLRGPFLALREKSHAAGHQDRQRWDLHMAAMFDALRPTEVTVDVMRRWVREVTLAGQSPSSIKVMLAILSGLFEEIQEQGLVQHNPAKSLPRSVRAMIRSRTDHKNRPFIERVEDVRRVIAAMPAPFNIHYALGALEGLRPAESIALEWPSVDLERNVVHVRWQFARGRLVPTKGKESRVVPIFAEMRPLLAEWRLKTGGKGLVCPPLRRRRGTTHLYRGSPNAALAAVLARLGLDREGLDFYGASRHTFASHYVLRGGNIHKLSLLLGHKSIAITEKHYLHLQAGKFVGDDGAIFGDGSHWRFSGELAALPVPAQGRESGGKRKAGAD